VDINKNEREKLKMCGIFGASRLTPEFRRMAPILALALKNRGQDSYGVTNGFEVVRKSGSQTCEWFDPPLSWNNSPFSSHNRGSSFRDNAADPECAHPFTQIKLDGTRIIGSHNGIIRNHTELNQKYSRNFSVDSMHIWAHRAEGRDWKELEGWGNLVWFEISPQGERELNFACINDSDLHIVTLADGNLVWASTLQAIKSAVDLFGPEISQLHPLNPKKRYILQTVDGRDVVKETAEEVEFKSFIPAYEGVHSLSGSWPGDRSGPPSYSPQFQPPVLMRTRSYLSVDCLICGNIMVNSQNKALCKGCFENQIFRWKTARITERK
jgi:hypothetical protein